MITISVERGLVRLNSWDELYETPGFVQVLDPKSAQLKEIIGVYSSAGRSLTLSFGIAMQSTG